MQPIIPGNIIGNSIPLSGRIQRINILRSANSRFVLPLDSKTRPRENTARLWSSPMCLAEKKGKSTTIFRGSLQSTNITRNAYITTINRGSIRADSPLITNKYLTSIASPLASRLCFQRFARFPFIRCVRSKRSSGEKVLSLFLRIRSSTGLNTVVWHRRLSLPVRIPAAAQNGRVSSSGPRLRVHKRRGEVFDFLPAAENLGNCRGFPTGSWQYRVS